MSSSWSSYFSIGYKRAIIEPPQVSAQQKDNTTPLCCPSLSAYALTRLPTYWPHVPRYQNRLGDFLTWINASRTSSEPSPGEEEEEWWEQITTTQDIDKADFVFSIATDGQLRDVERERERFYVHLPNNGFSLVEHEQDHLYFPKKQFLGTGNVVKLACPVCDEGFRVAILVRKGRSVDIQLRDVKDLNLRRQVEEMKEVFPEWRVDELRWVLLRHKGEVRKAMEEVQNKNLVEKKSV